MGARSAQVEGVWGPPVARIDTNGVAHDSKTGFALIREVRGQGIPDLGRNTGPKATTQLTILPHSAGDFKPLFGHPTLGRITSG